jgi:DNA polymerase
MRGADTLIDREAAASLIRWWRDAGVDTLVEDEARDWLARPARLEPTAIEPAPQPSTSAPPRPAAASAELPTTLDALLAWMRESADVPEARWGRTRLLPTGDPQSGLMILIDAPDRGDADAGTLLSGELGGLFDKMLAAIGRDRGSVWLAPFATVRPVGRVPQDAAARLTEIARRQIGLVAPRRLLIMGETPCRALFGSDVGETRGELRSLNHDAGTVECVATFHPRLLHERPTYKAQAWKDLQLLMKGL